MTLGWPMVLMNQDFLGLFFFQCFDLSPFETEDWTYSIKFKQVKLLYTVQCNPLF